MDNIMAAFLACTKWSAAYQFACRIRKLHDTQIKNLRLGLELCVPSAIIKLIIASPTIQLSGQSNLLRMYL